MQRLSFLHPHNRWSGKLHAYVDSELPPGATERFKEHLAECAGCAFAVAEARNLKRVLHALPEVPAPRSFTLTTGMVAPRPEPARLAPVPAAHREPRRLTPAIRFAQVAAGLAVLGLVAAGTADLAGGGPSSTESASKSAAEARDTLTNRDSASGPTGADPGAKGAAAATPATPGTPAAAAPAAGASGAGAAGGLPTARATDGGPYSYAESTPGQPNAATNPEPPAAAAAASPGAGQTSRLPDPRPAERGTSDRTLHGIELLFGGLLAASVAAWLFIRTKGQQG